MTPNTGDFLNFIWTSSREEWNTGVGGAAKAAESEDVGRRPGFAAAVWGHPAVLSRASWDRLMTPAWPYAPKNFMGGH